MGSTAPLGLALGSGIMYGAFDLRIQRFLGIHQSRS